LSGLPGSFPESAWPGQRSGGNGPVKKLGKQSLGGIMGAVGRLSGVFEDEAQVAKLKAVAAAISALADLAALGVDVRSSSVLQALQRLALHGRHRRDRRHAGTIG